MLERAWEYIAIAYQGRAYLALGYRTWDEYVDDRLGDLRLTVPREEREQAVAVLSDTNMSLRAIAKVLGVSPATAYRDLAGAKSGPDGEAEGAGPIGVRGRDGKQYPERRKAAEVACALCGETHPAVTQECPWDPGLSLLRNLLTKTKVFIRNRRRRFRLLRHLRRWCWYPRSRSSRPSPEQCVSSTNSKSCPTWLTRLRSPASRRTLFIPKLTWRRAFES